jgi:hypothetical protein
MVGIDAALQRTAGLGLYSPSVFLKLRAAGTPAADVAVDANADALFHSPRTGLPLRRDGDALVCDGDGTRWHATGNFFDFKEPVGA